MKYDLKKERTQKGVLNKYIGDNVPGLSKGAYSKFEKEGNIPANMLYLLHKYCGFTLPDDFHKYDMTTIKVNCIINNLKAGEVLERINKKTGISMTTLNRYWQKKELYSLYDYKDVVDELFSEIYVPCIIDGKTAREYGMESKIFPVDETRFYRWKYIKDEAVLKEGIVAAKSKENAVEKLERWHLCNVDEYFEVYAETEAIKSDVGVYAE